MAKKTIAYKIQVPIASMAEIPTAYDKALYMANEQYQEEYGEDEIMPYQLYGNFCLSLEAIQGFMASGTEDLIAHFMFSIRM